MVEEETTICVVVDPPQELIDKAEKHGKDPFLIWHRAAHPRKLIGRLPVQLLAGIEFCDDPVAVENEKQYILAELCTGV